MPAFALIQRQVIVTKFLFFHYAIVKSLRPRTNAPAAGEHLHLNLTTVQNKKLAAEKILLFFFVFLTGLQAYAQLDGPGENHHLLQGKDFLKAKNYYLLTVFGELLDVKALLLKDKALSGIAQTHLDSLCWWLKNCDRNGDCYIRQLKFNEAEIKTVSERLDALHSPANALDRPVQNYLAPSGSYVLLQNLSPKEMLVKACEQDAAGVNYALDVYAGEEKPCTPTDRPLKNLS